MKKAKSPFCFVAASYLTRIRLERARTPKELLGHLRAVSDQSIFFHTFQSLESHNYTVFSNDFAQWAVASCNEQVLGEALGALDMRDFVSIQDLRRVLVDTVDNYLRRNPNSADRPAFEPFYFCEAVEIMVPLEACASDLAELEDGIRKMSLQTLHHHFINARLRLELASNDFSNWIEGSLDLPVLAKRLDRIDIYTNTLEGVRRRILEEIEPWNQL